MKKIIFLAIFGMACFRSEAQVDKVKPVKAAVGPVDDRAKLEKQKTELKQLLDKVNIQLAELQKNADRIEAIRKEMDKKMKELESQDKLGNFEIQDLMSRYNQAETLSSNVQKKLKDTHDAVINKL